MEPIARLTTDVAEVKTDVAEVKTDVADLARRFTISSEKWDRDIAQIQQTLIRHDERFDRIDRRMDTLADADSLAQLMVVTNNIFNLLNELVLQVVSSKVVEKRLNRLELAVFGTKP